MDGILTIIFIPISIIVRLLQTLVETIVFLIQALRIDDYKWMYVVGERKSVIYIDDVTLRLGVYMYEQPPKLELTIVDTLVKSLTLKP